MAFRIRPAEVEDARPMCVVHIAAWQNAYRGLFPDAPLDELDLEERTRARRRMLASPRSPAHRAWVIEEDGALLGFAMTGPARDQDLDASSHELYAIYLAPERIGTGLGRRLWAHVRGDLTERGYAEVVLWVLSENRLAGRFYEAAGFAPDPRVPEREHADTGCFKRRLVRPL